MAQFCGNLITRNSEKILFWGGLCHDTDGRIYVANWNAGIIIINSGSGEFLQHVVQDVKRCQDVCWTSSPPQVTVL